MNLKKTNTNKGITLIALVITVIVLLILAGTAISIAVNGGNIFAKANTAVESYNAKAAQQETAITGLNTQFDEYYTGYNQNQTPAEPTPTSNEPTPTPTPALPAGWDGTKVASTVSGTITVDSNTNVSVTAPIPTGYVASDVEGENTIVGGLVIYQGTDPVSTDEDAITTRNQFVWIPVTNINSMIMCKENNQTTGVGDTKICNIVLEDGELKCTVHNTTGAANICGRLYGADSAKDNEASTNGNNVYKTSINFALNTQTFSANSYYCEPAIVTGNYTGDGTSYDGASNNYHGLSSASAFLTQLQGDFYAMAKSVALYKGFYIARYEAGYDSTTYTSKKGQVVMNASTTANVGANRWYGLYNHLRTFVGDENHPMGVLNSQMIWGCQYDQAIKFIKQNKGTNDLDPEIGHTNIGLASDKRTSGAVTGDIMKNIYDLEGNYYELTAQASSINKRVGHGGYYSIVINSDFYPASYRGSSFPTSTSGTSSSRSGLYL